MALTVEDGSVVTGADCYENAATAAARIALFAPSSSFSGKTEAQQEAIIRRRTAESENEIRPGAEGSLVDSGQSRLFPRSRCFNVSGKEYDNDEIPEPLLAGIAHRCEDDAAGRIPVHGRRIAAMSDGQESIRYQADNTSAFSEVSPESWAHLSQLFWTT